MCQTLTETRPDGSSALFTFDTSAGTDALNTLIQYYSGAVGGNAALTIQNNYECYGSNGATGTCGQFAQVYPHLKIRTVTIPGPGGNLVAQTSMAYDHFLNNLTQVTTGKLLSKAEYGFGLGAAGPLLRTTAYSYLDDANPNYRSTVNGITNNVMDRVSDMQIQDASGTTKAETKIFYDTPSQLTSITGVQSHDDSNYGVSYIYRGNPTLIQKLVSGSFFNAETITYDTTGQLTQVQDARNNTTTFNYADRFYNDGSPAHNPPSSFSPSTPTNAFLT